ncbi:MAG: TetR/AcrR family transcriptional regulator [Coriobacteriaceae bacterium]|nr:TetR/AcrR family transcriptional regulator [Coriobacteriaceae bacterium]
MDLRIQKTYRSLLMAFTKLLETHRYEDVTVAMLCDEAMIRRTTFYKHFADKAEFFSFFVDSLRVELTSYGERTVQERRAAAGEAVDGAPARSDADPEEGLAILEALVRFMLDHEKLVDNIFESSMSGMMVLMMEDRVAETIRERYRVKFQAHPDRDVTLLAASEFAAGGIVRVLEKWWVYGHHKESETEVITMAETMVTRVLAG